MKLKTRVMWYRLQVAMVALAVRKGWHHADAVKAKWLAWADRNGGSF
jgi:hypothetical protein